jgi:hypothetical protein
MLTHVSENMVKRAQMCLEGEGGHSALDVMVCHSSILTLSFTHSYVTVYLLSRSNGRFKKWDFPHISCPSYHEFYPMLGHEHSVQYQTSKPLSITYNILSLTYSVLLTSDMIILCTKNLYLIHDSHSPFHICLIVRCHPCPIWPPVPPINLTYIFILPLQLPWANLPYIDFLHCTHQISYPVFLAQVVYPNNLSKSDALCNIS